MVDLFGYWFVETSYKYDYDTDVFSEIGYYDPNYYDILILFMISGLLRLGVEKISEIATKLSGGFSFATNSIPYSHYFFLKILLFRPSWPPA